MLLRLSASNNLSLRDPQELLLTASSLKDAEEGLIDCQASPSGSALPAVIVYGANASGKSNLVAAAVDMRAMVLFSHTKGLPGGGVPRRPFRLDAVSQRRLTRFEADFVIEGVRHHYGFEASDTAFETEWLHAYPKGRRRILFDREGSDFVFGRGLKGPNIAISKLTRPNSLFVSAAAQNDHEQLSAVYAYFGSIRVNLDFAVQGPMALRLVEENPDPRVIRFLAGIDTGIVGYRRENTEIPSEARAIWRELLKAVRKATSTPFLIEHDLDDPVPTLELAHRGQGGRKFYLEFGSESAGTKRLLVLLRLAFQALDEGRPLIVDELDASLHTHACEEVLRLFCSPDTNPKGAQLIATTHTTGLMSSSMLRRDQIWFTEKNCDGATRLYPLTDIRTRKGDNVERGYRQGRFGGVPFRDRISDHE